MAATGVISYSPNGSFLAVCSPDGRLSLWDTTSATITQQYTPSSHLSATCTCLSWCPTRTEPAKKKRRSHKLLKRENDASAISTSDLLAMGTRAGTILLYSLAKADLHRHMDQGHTDKVNDMCWHPDGETIFSCSDDQHIVEWDATHGQVKCKWKADTHSVHSVCLCPGARALLSAGRMIQLWDMDTKKVLRKFTGHASPVTRLKVVPSSTSESSRVMSSLESVEGLYFLSCAERDRVLNVWQVRSALKSKSSIASLVVPDEPLDFDILNSSKDQKTYLSVVTRSGEVHIFDPVLNGKAKNQVQARSHLLVSTEGGKDISPRPIPILAALLCPELRPPILIAHGSILKLTFERVSFLSEDKSICLIREDPSTQAIPQVSGEKLKKPVVTGAEVVKTPSVLAHTGYRAAAEGESAVEGRKSKRKSSQSMVSIEDRLVALNVAGAQVDMSTQDQSAKTGSLVMLLTQGLQSSDKTMLDSVFQQQKESVIRRTIQRLPIPLVVSLVQELASRMNTTPQSGLVLAQWTKVVLRERASYLMTCPELLTKLSQVYEMINTRTHQSTRMMRLHGKLDLMLAQIASQKQCEEEQDRPMKAALIYEEDSSDEGDIIEEPYPMQSESEGEWEELSEMDAQESQVVQDAEEQGGHESDMSDLEEDEGEVDEDEDEVVGEPSSSEDD
ncbi:WD repeat-containing protein 43-like [Acanthaster planci]|uniref:WD repeat-containing protein 43-like n=1 Tax=Acanthaster planci TaxID=133434 RepID=A0A8B7ZFM6_ACAPL|nr:WD repeat-containing protein 43-like [Acanthaster planci]